VHLSTRHQREQGRSAPPFSTARCSSESDRGARLWEQAGSIGATPAAGEKVVCGRLHAEACRLLSAAPPRSPPALRGWSARSDSGRIASLLPCLPMRPYPAARSSGRGKSGRRPALRHVDPAGRDVYVRGRPGERDRLAVQGRCQVPGRAEPDPEPPGGEARPLARLECAGVSVRRPPCNDHVVRCQTGPVVARIRVRRTSGSRPPVTRRSGGRRKRLARRRARANPLRRQPRAAPALP